MIVVILFDVEFDWFEGQCLIFDQLGVWCFYVMDKLFVFGECGIGECVCFNNLGKVLGFDVVIVSYDVLMWVYGNMFVVYKQIKVCGLLVLMGVIVVFSYWVYGEVSVKGVNEWLD